MAKRARKLYTLQEVAKLTGISLTSLQRYKKAHQERLPSVGEGRKQRYPHAALKVFKEIRRENEERRGRTGRRSPRSKTTAGRTRGGGSDAKLLTLLEIGRMTGISYPTLLRYVRLYLDRLPHEGAGRRRRFRPEAVAVFQELRDRSRRGRRGPATASGEGARSVDRRLQKLEEGQRGLAKQLRELEKALKRPLRITLQR